MKDGADYVWDVEKGHHEHKTLIKEVGKEKVEVARWAQKHGYERDGLLLVDGQQVDDLVAVLTICAVLEVNDSFTK